MHKKTVFTLAVSAMLLTACGSKNSTDDMQYIKTSVLYDTISDMYDNPDQYLGKNFHMVGTLYPSTEDDGTKFYSIYAEESPNSHGIGLELDWSDYSGLEDYDTVTVEGKLDKDKGMHDGEEVEYLVLRVSMLEKRGT